MTTFTPQELQIADTLENMNIGDFIDFTTDHQVERESDIIWIVDDKRKTFIEAFFVVANKERPGRKGHKKMTQEIITKGVYLGVAYQIIRNENTYSGIILNSDGTENFETQRYSAGYKLNTIGALKAATGACRNTIDNHKHLGMM